MKTRKTLVYGLILALMFVGYQSYGASGSLPDFLFDYPFDSNVKYPRINYGATFSIDETFSVLQNAFNDSDMHTQKLLWENENRASFRTNTGKLIYYKNSGTFKYTLNDWLEHDVLECDNEDERLYAVERFLNKIKSIMPDFPSSTFFIQRHRYIEDGGDNLGNLRPSRTVLYEYRYGRYIEDKISIGPGADLRVYVDPCGNIKGLSFNWRKILVQVDSDTIPIKTQIEVIDTIKNYRLDFLDNFEGFLADEFVKCGYYEPQTGDEAVTAEPVCIYEATHYLYPYCSENATINPVQLTVSLGRE